MTQTHPAIPPADQLKKWEDKWFDEEEHADVLLIQAFQAGADQELDACCKQVAEWQEHWECKDERLRAARRSKPLSLKEQALAALSEMSIEPCLINGVDANAAVRAKYNTIRRALEALDD